MKNILKKILNKKKAKKVTKKAKDKPKAKKVEKIMPIEVSSPIFVFLTIKPRNIATTIAAGAPSSEILNPKKTPTAIIGRVA